MIRFLLLVLLSVLVGCEQSNYGERLGTSNYFLEDRDRSHIYIVHVKDGHAVVAVDQMVVDHRVEGKYLFVLQKVATSFECRTESGKSVIATIYTNRDAYWLIDLDAGKEQGPFDSQTYFRRLKDIGRDAPMLRTPQDYATNEGTLPANGASCTAIGQKSTKK